MNYTAIKVKITYESKDSQTIICKPNESIKEILLSFAANNGIDFNSVYFLINGKKIEKSDYEQPINKFCSKLNEGELNILTYDIFNTEETNLRTIPFNTTDKIEIIFWYESSPIKFETSLKTKIEDISKSFAKRIGKNLDELEFIYRNEEITFNNSKILGEIVSQSDINRKKIEIKRYQ